MPNLKSGKPRKEEEEDDEDEDSFLMANWMNHADRSDEGSDWHDESTVVIERPTTVLQCKVTPKRSKMDITEAVANILNQVRLEKERTMENFELESEEDQHKNFNPLSDRSKSTQEDYMESGIQTPHPPNPKRLTLLEKVLHRPVSRLRWKEDKFVGLSQKVKEQPTSTEDSKLLDHEHPDDSSINHGNIGKPAFHAVRDRKWTEPALIARNDSSSSMSDMSSTYVSSRVTFQRSAVSCFSLVVKHGFPFSHRQSHHLGPSPDPTIGLAVYRPTGQYNLQVCKRGFPFEMPKYTDCFDSANGPSSLVERGDSKKHKKTGQFYRGKYKTKSLVDLGERFDDYSPYATNPQAIHKSTESRNTYRTEQQDTTPGTRKSFIDEIMKRGTAIVDKPKAPNWRSVGEYFVAERQSGRSYAYSDLLQRSSLDFYHYT
ncbi:hypothetical protein GUITHDRAFT_100921 [Guillardia theta CCMP2712]|uniref:Uncharacterized protein n=1 Tax=Guillardia theta (strain CCMP2712) TaxID=905079 RepID=L1JXA4_GUITC|nr:hypothetical protein GUITHDRAFT_100921 [Guillardia theta CCMP2712]EKX53211.1 hypothetical protein GUITHDRAFT_100921 [Guillardia theta CCMP2712]|eukprot:XP_005840191.1 hypothetical protein GUITHDRAFT_100921 [Guillardia theta CCMP2712]